MNLHDFVLTQHKPQRYARHALFWLVQAVFWCSLIPIPQTASLTLFVVNLKGLGFMLLHIGYTYFVVYYLMPHYFFAGKQGQFARNVLLLTTMVYAIWLAYLFGTHQPVYVQTDDNRVRFFYYTMSFIVQGPPVACLLFFVCHTLIRYYRKGEEKRQLIVENSKAELQLLQAQVHPHFLFNTLNNIYSFALCQSPETSNLIARLSNTIRYMVHDCDTPMVPLRKELQLVQDYIGLEKIRYGNRLQLSVTITGDARQKRITPLLLIPFVENSFKHGAGKSLGDCFIHLHITIADAALNFELINSKGEETKKSVGGIGLQNVQKRLTILYPERHTLQLENGSETYRVKMQIPLLHISRPSGQPSAKTLAPTTYAR